MAVELRMRLAVLRAVGLCVLSAFPAGGAAADGAGWTIVESSGAVSVAAPMGAPHLASTKEALAPGTTLTTGGMGRAILTNGAQQIVVGPNSRMSLPVKDSGGMTQVLQDLGTLLFKVDKRPEQHFTVETPFIAAIVKGTTFTVTAGPMSHSVHVVEGLVEVATPSGNSHEFVRPGMTAIVSRSNPTVIDIAGGNAPSATPINDVVPQGAEPSSAPTLLDAGAPASAVAPAARITTKTESTFEIGPGALDMTALTDGFIQSTPAQATIATSAEGAAASATASPGGSQSAETSSSGRTITVETGGGVASAGGQAAANAAGPADPGVGSTLSTAVTSAATITNPGITGAETTLTNVVGGTTAALGNAAGNTVTAAAATAGGSALGNSLSTVTTTLGAATSNGNGNGGSVASVVNSVLGTDSTGVTAAGNGNGNALGLVNNALGATTTSGTSNGNGNALGAVNNALTGATAPGNSGSNSGTDGNSGNSNSSSGTLAGGITGSSGTVSGNSGGNGGNGGNGNGGASGSGAGGSNGTGSGSGSNSGNGSSGNGNGNGGNSGNGG